MTDSRDISAPAPGYFKTRMIKGGPFVGARIYRPCSCTVVGTPDDFEDSGAAEHDWTPACDRYSNILNAEIAGKPVDVSQVWERGQRIAKAEYDYLMADMAWALENSPEDPMAKPRESIDLNKLASIF